MDTPLSKHAYLIIAHSRFPLLCQLLRQLDDPRNDIFLLIDKKSPPFPASSLYECVQKSTLYIHPDPIAIYWGDYSQIESELLLMEYASSTSHYAYYHLLSGQCLPIKSQDYIHSFFQKHAGAQFVSINNIDIQSVSFRYRYYFPFLKSLKAPKSLLGKGFTYANVLLQKILGINRVRHCNVEFKKGGNWFSITHSFLLHVLTKKEWIEETFRNTYCCDEVFLQTILYQSEFYKDLYINPHGANHMRYTDWKRGNPYTFRLSDAAELMNTPMLFARKLDDLTAAQEIHRLCIENEDKHRLDHVT